MSDVNAAQFSFDPMPSGSPHMSSVWQDLDRAYEVERRHNANTAKLNRQQMSFAVQQFQAQLLGLAVLREGTTPLIEDPVETADVNTKVTKPDPTVQQ